jgi:transcriptional regulator with GAF, ATPase, and Fis domain
VDPRPEKGQFVVIDCTTMTPDLAGSELFGHEQGAFTGATYRREGALALADKGTLFLDEIGELPVVLQAKILRAVQEHIYKRVGSNTWQQSDFRLICATNRNLEEEMQQGQFRSDLFFRISGLICTLPPLRERTEDILPLVQHFFRELRSEEAPELDTRVQEYFLSHNYPGNVRELKHRVMRVIHRYTGFGPLSIGCIPPYERESEQDKLIKDFEQLISRLLASGRGLKEIRRLAEETAVRLAITDANGKLKVAAQRLGVTDRALQMRQAKTKHLMTQSGEVSYRLK